MSELWFVRYFLREGEEITCLDEGPWERCLAEYVLEDIGANGTIRRGIEPVEVDRAMLVSAGPAWLYE